jgi:K+-transporting ATPase A subunit
MKINMGKTDRFLRVLLAIIVGGLIITGQLTGLAAVILGIFAVIFLGTSLIGFCPLYLPLKISTKKRTNG